MKLLKYVLILSQALSWLIPSANNLMAQSCTKKRVRRPKDNLVESPAKSRRVILYIRKDEGIWGYNYIISFLY